MKWCYNVAIRSFHFEVIKSSSILLIIIKFSVPILRGSTHITIYNIQS